MFLPTTAILLCLVPLLAQAQLVDDFSSPFAKEGTNTLRLWRGGDLVSGVSGGVSIATSGWWSEVIAPPTTCNDLTGKSLKFAYTSTAAGQRTVEFHMKAASCQGARAATAVARVNVVAGAGELTVPMSAFAGANPRLGFAFAFLGPLTVRRVEIVGGGTTPPPTDSRCVLSSAAVGGCSADKLCPNGLCCSQYGWCGNTAAYCSTGCQSQCSLTPVLGLRSCDAPTTPPVASTIPDPTANARDWVPSTALTNGRFERDAFGSYLSCGWPSAIALTYDDGPNPTFTPTILSALATANIKTTFFWLGSLIRDNKALAQRAAAAGHHLASHSWSHPDLTTLSAADLNNEITMTETEIRSVVGLRPRYFRPPYGSINQAVFNRLAAGGYRVILWNFDTLDWAAATTEQGIVDQYRTQALNPAGKSYITLQHDIQAKSAAVAGRVYAQVKANGFKAVPMYICLNELAYQN